MAAGWAQHPEPAATLHGNLKSLTKSEITINVDADQDLTLRRTRRTKFLKGGREIRPNDIPVGAAVTVEATTDPDLKLSARSVTVAR